MTPDEMLFAVLANVCYLLLWAERVWFRTFVYPGNGL